MPIHPEAKAVMRLPKYRVGKFFTKYKAECVDLGVSWVYQPNVHSHITVQAVLNTTSGGPGFTLAFRQTTSKVKETQLLQSVLSCFGMALLRQ